MLRKIGIVGAARVRDGLGLGRQRRRRLVGRTEARAGRNRVIPAVSYTHLDVYKRQPCRRSDNFSARVLFAGGVTAGLAPHLQAAGGAIDVETARARMIDTYAGMPYRSALVATLRLYLAALAEHDAPSLVHCVAGKDRTGFAVAIVHRLVGVHEDDLMHDYLLTNTAGKIEERIAQGAAHIRARYGAEIKDCLLYTSRCV